MNTSNILKSRDVYSRYYGDFRGVDFSNDHTQIIDQRLAYAVNMYKDYQSGQGKAIETIPGFRRRVMIPDESEIYGIHYFEIKDNNGVVPKILIHAGKNLYLWHNYPLTIGVSLEKSVQLGDPTSTSNLGSTFTIDLSDINIAEIKTVTANDGNYSITGGYNPVKKTYTIFTSTLKKGDTLFISYTEGEISNPLFSDMNERKSEAFVFNNRLYIIDGKNYIYFDGEQVHRVVQNAYVPTTYRNIVISGENAYTVAQYEQSNLLQPKFINTFIPDGITSEYRLYEKNLDQGSQIKVVVYGVEKNQDAYHVDYDNGTITFKAGHIPPVHSSIASELNKEGQEGEEERVLVNSSSEAGDITNADKYPRYHAGVEITAQKTYDSTIITNCTLSAIFDGRVFLSGNSNFPNNVYFCGFNHIAGRADPSYFPVPFYQPDGTGISEITGMLVVADTLMVIKADSIQDGSIYYHSPQATGDDLYEKTYPSVRGLAGVGGIGACINFYDDPIYISRLGVEGVSQLKIASERAIEHRSSLIDAKLVNLNLQDVCVSEWNGYLLVLVDGKIFMADSRQRYTDALGTMQYEWYYLEDIGIFEGQYSEYLYASAQDVPDNLGAVEFCKECKNAASDCTCGNEDNFVTLPLVIADDVQSDGYGESLNLTGTPANLPHEDGTARQQVFTDIVTVEFGEDSADIRINYVVNDKLDKAYVCIARGNKTGGVFKKAKLVLTLQDNLYFATENGVICSFNFDKRDEYGEISPLYYSFDDRIINCGCATKMDNCGVPHMTKSTKKKSTVIKTKTLQSSSAKIKVRTNKKPYSQVARINNTIFSFENLDFFDFSFETIDQSLFAVKEKEKQWVEKQYYIYSDEYLKPFALFYVTYQYQISGRYKDRR